MAVAPDIHPSAFVGTDVTLGEGVSVGPGAVLLGPLTVGARVWIGPHAVIGTPPEVSSLPQHATWSDEQGYAGVFIDDDAVIREHVTIQQGSVRTTRIGKRTWLLSAAYVAHDGLVGDDVTLSAGVRLGGHTTVGDRANLGMNAVVHQRRIVGPGAMVGMGTPVTRDVPPFAKVYGSPARVRGVNAFLLGKLGVPARTSEELAAAYARDESPAASEEFPEVVADAFRWWDGHETRRTGAAS